MTEQDEAVRLLRLALLDYTGGLEGGEARAYETDLRRFLATPPPEQDEMVASKMEILRLRQQVAEQDEAVRAALITSGLMHRLRDYARRAYTDMQDETEADLAAAWAPRVAAALATSPPVPAAPGLDDSEIATIRKALSIGFVSWDGDGWYASPDHLGEDGTSYEDAEATFREAHRILARLSPVQEEAPDD